MWELRRIAGAAGLVLAAMLIVAFALDLAIIGTTAGQPVIGLASIGADLERARNSGIWPLEAWLYTLQIVPFGIFILGVRSAYRGSELDGLAAAATVAGLLFMILHTLHNLAILTVVQVLAPAYTPGATDATAIEAVSRGLIGLANAAFIPGGGVGSVLLVLASAGFAIAQGRTRALGSGWAGPLAWATAVLTALGFAQPIVPAALLVALLGFIAFIAWVSVAAVSLLRAAPRASMVVAPGTA